MISMLTGLTWSFISFSQMSNPTALRIGLRGKIGLRVPAEHKDGAVLC